MLSSPTEDDLCYIFLSSWLRTPKCWSESTYKATNSPRGTEEEFHWHAHCTGLVNPEAKGCAEGEAKAASSTIFLTMGSPRKKAAALALFKLSEIKGFEEHLFSLPYFPLAAHLGCSTWTVKNVNSSFFLLIFGGKTKEIR